MKLRVVTMTREDMRNGRVVAHEVVACGEVRISRMVCLRMAYDGVTVLQRERFRVRFHGGIVLRGGLWKQGAMRLEWADSVHVIDLPGWPVAPVQR